MDKRPLLVSSRSIIDAFDAGCSRAGGHGDICAGPSLAEFPTKELPIDRSDWLADESPIFLFRHAVGKPATRSMPLRFKRWRPKSLPSGDGTLRQRHPRQPRDENNGSLGAIGSR